MAEKYHDQQGHTPAPAPENTKTDEESATVQPNELKKKKRIKCAIYIILFAIFQTAILAVFALTVLKIKNPKLRFGSVTVQEMVTTRSANNATSAFTVRFDAQVSIKNTNFGHFKFDANTVSFFHGGVTVGTVVVPAGRARARSTKRMDLTVRVDFSGVKSASGVEGELGSNVVTLTSRAELRGKVELMKVMKKRTSAEMDCTVSFNVLTKTTQDLKCK